MKQTQPLRTENEALITVLLQIFEETSKRRKLEKRVLEISWYIGQIGLFACKIQNQYWNYEKITRKEPNQTKHSDIYIFEFLKTFTLSKKMIKHWKEKERSNETWECWGWKKKGGRGEWMKHASIRLCYVIN